MRATAALIALLLISCSSSVKTDLSTPEKFFAQLLEAVTSGNRKDFDALFVGEKDTEELVKLDTRTSPQKLEEVIKDFSEVTRMLAKSSYTELTSAIKGTSATYELKKYKVVYTDGLPAVNELSATVSTGNGAKRTITVGRIVRLGEQWKSVREITIL